MVQSDYHPRPIIVRTFHKEPTLYNPSMTSLLMAAALFGCHNTAVGAEAPKSIYDFTQRDIDGQDVLLRKYTGKVLLVVNVASKCGLTPQYKGLEALYREKKAEGLVILGFPANNFGSQEPGTESEIKEFCSTKYDVTFPMFSKISVKGDDVAPLYRWLLLNSDRHDDIEWNFAKFVIGRDGRVFRRLTPKDTPDSPAVREAVEAALGQK
jgi:glutathione peroxidase